MSVDTFVALILLAVIFGASGLYGLSKLYFRAMGVNTSPAPTPAPAPRYVAPPAPAPSVPVISPVVTDAEADAEAAAETYVPPPGAVETPYIRVTQQQLDEVKARAWLEGAAHAVGTLQGAGYLDAVVSAERLTDAKRTVFGGSGRKLTAANKLIAVAAEKATPAERELRLVPVRDGAEGHVEM